MNVEEAKRKLNEIPTNGLLPKHKEDFTDYIMLMSIVYPPKFVYDTPETMTEAFVDSVMDVLNKKLDEQREEIKARLNYSIPVRDDRLYNETT